MYEFSKLSAIDLNVASWLFDKCPDRLFSYLEYIAKEDYPRRGIKLNTQQLFRELLEVHSMPLPLGFNFFSTGNQISDSFFFNKVKLQQSTSSHSPL